MTLDELIEELLMRHFRIHWSGKSTDQLPQAACSKQFQALRDFATSLEGPKA